MQQICYVKVQRSFIFIHSPSKSMNRVTPSANLLPLRVFQKCDESISRYEPLLEKCWIVCRNPQPCHWLKWSNYWYPRWQMHTGNQQQLQPVNFSEVCPGMKMIDGMDTCNQKKDGKICIICLEKPFGIKELQSFEREEDFWNCLLYRSCGRKSRKWY